MNGVTGGNINIIDGDEHFSIERTFNYKEALLMALVFTILPVWMFFSPLYSLVIKETLIDHRILSYIGLFIVWGIFFLGNMVVTTVKFSALLQNVRAEIIEADNV